MARRLTYEEVKSYIESKGCKLLSKKYVNGKTKLEIVCKCGKPFKRTMKNFKYNHVCLRCGSNALLYEDVKQHIESKGCKLISNEYINNETPLEIQCPCLNTYFVMYRDFKSKKRYKCPTCNKRQTQSYEDVRAFIESKGCQLISKEYINNSTPLDIMCKCGCPFKRKYNNFKDSKQYYCNKCTTQSKGEEKIIQILSENKVRYIYQHKFDNCKFKKVLTFDFFLPEYNILIEYDGRQHYEISEFFGGLDEFIRVKIRDTVKDMYCKENNIKLIRIPYWEYKNLKKHFTKILKENIKI